MRTVPLNLIKKRVAVLAIGSSTLRNQGAKGVAESARKFLDRLNLEAIAEGERVSFGRRLNRATENMQRTFPAGAKNWGAARKAINLFLRDVLYNRYLSAQYRFDRIAGHLEVPLDGDVARALRSEPEGADLPRWPSIKHLTPEISALYQAVAKSVAERMGTTPVHLDLHYWRRDV